MKDIKAKLIFNEEIAPRTTRVRGVPGYFRMGLEAPSLARLAKPGQFVQVRCGETTDPLLRRPLGIHRVKGEGSRGKGIEILYEVVGRGTGFLSRKKEVEFLDVLGPLGNGFNLPSFTLHPSPFTLLIAGGIGVAPLVFLAEVLAERKIKSVVLLGAKTKKKILCEKDFNRAGAEVHITTDDGTCGCKGLVPKLFEDILRTTNHESLTTIYACGPEPMLKCIAGISERYSVHCQALLEEKMACGFGACLGCTVKVRQAGREQGFINKLTCKDGPVFDTRELIWN